MVALECVNTITVEAQGRIGGTKAMLVGRNVMSAFRSLRVCQDPIRRGDREIEAISVRGSVISALRSLHMTQGPVRGGRQGLVGEALSAQRSLHMREGSVWGTPNLMITRGALALVLKKKKLTQY